MVKYFIRGSPGILKSIFHDHGGFVGGGQGVATERVAPGKVARRKHARAIADDDFVRVQERHKRIARAKAGLDGAEADPFVGERIEMRERRRRRQWIRGGVKRVLGG